MEAEIWKDVSEYPDVFMISQYGRVYSKRTNKILVQGKTKTGYYVISSRIGGRTGKCICKKVHRWVAEAFIDNPENKPVVNHKDGDKLNNYVDNLEWCTFKENSIHAYSTGLAKPSYGEKHIHSKLTDDDVRFIRKYYVERCNKYGVTALSKKYKVAHSTIIDVLRFNTWKHVK